MKIFKKLIKIHIVENMEKIFRNFFVDEFSNCTPSAILRTRGRCPLRSPSYTAVVRSPKCSDSIEARVNDKLTAVAKHPRSQAGL